MRKLSAIILAVGGCAIVLLALAAWFRSGRVVTAQTPIAPPSSFRPYVLETEETLTFPAENGHGTQTRKSLRFVTSVRSDGSRSMKTIHPAGFTDWRIERADGVMLRALDHPTRKFKTTRQSLGRFREIIASRFSPELDCRQSYSLGRPAQALETVIGKESMPGVPGQVVRLKAPSGMISLFSLEFGCAEVGRLAVFQNKNGTDSSLLQLVSLKLAEPPNESFLVPGPEFQELARSDFFKQMYATTGGRQDLPPTQIQALQKLDESYRNERPVVTQ